MVREETMLIADRPFTRTWSDAGRYVVRDGVTYIEAIDPAAYHDTRSYEEGEIIEHGEQKE